MLLIRTILTEMNGAVKPILKIRQTAATQDAKNRIETGFLRKV